MKNDTTKERTVIQILKSWLFLATMISMMLFLADLTPVFATTMSVQWDAVTGNGVVGYKVYYKADTAGEPYDGVSATEGSSPIDVSNVTTTTLSGLVAGKTYYSVVTAYDADGNESAYSNLLSFTVANPAPDAIAPTASITAPSSNAVVSGTVSVVASANDNVGVSRVDFYINGSLRASANTSPYSFNWITTAETNGAYSLLCKAYDAAGNIGTTSTVPVTVNNIVPDVTAPVISAFTMPTTATSLTVSVSSLTATDAVGVTGYLITESSTTPTAGAAGWSASAPANFTFSAAGSKTAYAWAKDAAGNVSASANRTVVITLPDTTAPAMSAFIMPTTATSLTVSVSSLTATDAIGVTGYLVTESSTTPTAGAAGWSASAPANFNFSSAGSKTAYAWAKDAAGNVSASASRTVVITLADVLAPVVSAFTMPTTATSLTVSVSSLTATDAVGVTGYLITESSTAPTAGAAGWSTSAPANFTFSAAGSKTAYAWAKDAAGNVSASANRTVVITLADVLAPVVSAFTMPTTATSLTVSVSSLTATDAVGVTGYLITESLTAPTAGAAGWSATAPTNFTFSAAGSKTAYAWAKDAAGNVSAARTAAVVITIPTNSVYTIYDALLALRVASGKITPTSEQKTRLDVAPVVNGISVPNGIINSGDVTVIMSKLIGKSTL